jgi:hypothetical protein
VDISQNDLDQLEFVQRILGCGGCLNPVKLQPNQRRQCYVLSYDGRSAIEVLIKIRPYLRRKRNEADECIWLFVAGNLSRMPGPRGLDPELVTLRRASVLRIKGMK